MFSDRRLTLALVSILVLLPRLAWAQADAEPMAAMVKTLFDRVTPNATTNVDHRSHFFLGGENVDPATRTLNAALAMQLSTFPLASSSGGFTYSVSPNGDIVPTSTTFGPLFAERAVTIGKNKLNFGYTFQHTNYTSFEGADLENGDLGFVSEHNNCCPPNPANPGLVNQPTDGLPEFERDLLVSRLRANIDTNTTAFFANYGVTNRFDIGVAVPIVNVSVDAAVTGQIIRTATSATNPPLHAFDASGTDTLTVANRDSATGLGDILLRAKYNLFRGTTTSFAAALDLRLPTGDSDNLLGTGATRATVFGIASGEYGRFSPHVNLGYTFSNGEGSSELIAADSSTEALLGPIGVGRVDSDPNVDLTIPNEFNYTFGFTVAAHPRVTVGFDMRGRTLIDVARFGVRDVTYPNRTPGIPTGGPFTVENEFALDEPRQGNLNQLLGVIGGKVNIAGTFLLNITLLLPMTDEGLKATPTPVIGFDYIF